MAILTVTPVAQGIATTLAEIGGETSGGQAVDPPVLVGGGSVTDASDSSYVEIGAWYDESISASHLEILTCDFVLAPGVTPTAMALQVRASTPSATYATPPAGGRYWWHVYSAVDAPTVSFDGRSMAYGAFGPMALCTLSTPTTAETFWGEAADLANPTDPGNWCELAPAADGGGEMYGAYEALTGTGLRVSMFIEQYNTGFSEAPTSRIPWVNVHEVRLLIAGTEAAAPYVPQTTAHPSLRMLQRGGTGGMSGIWRMVGNPTTRDSLRRGPGSIL